MKDKLGAVTDGAIYFKKRSGPAPIEILWLTCLDMGFAKVGIMANLACTVLPDGSFIDWRKL